MKLNIHYLLLLSLSGCLFDSHKVAGKFCEDGEVVFQSRTEYDSLLRESVSTTKRRNEEWVTTKKTYHEDGSIVWSTYSSGKLPQETCNMYKTDTLNRVRYGYTCPPDPKLFSKQILDSLQRVVEDYFTLIDTTLIMNRYYEYNDVEKTSKEYIIKDTGGGILSHETRYNEDGKTKTIVIYPTQPGDTLKTIMEYEYHPGYFESKVYYNSKLSITNHVNLNDKGLAVNSESCSFMK